LAFLSQPDFRSFHWFLSAPAPLPTSINILSIHLITAESDAGEISAGHTPAVYVPQSGRWKLAYRLPGVSVDTEYLIQSGDLAIWTSTSLEHRLILEADVRIGECPAARCLKVSFQASGAAESLLTSLPPILTAFSPFDPRTDCSSSPGDLHPSDAEKQVWRLLIGVICGRERIAGTGYRAESCSPEIQQTLMAMKQAPGRAWTIERLGDVAGMSRSAFAQKFKEQVGITPNEHLVNLRMQLASTFLKDRRQTLKSVANLTGYQSVSAFSNAYKRWSGKTPRQQSDQ